VNAPLIGYRHNPCRACGKHVDVPPNSMCLDCLCRELDASGVTMRDVARAIVEHEIAADLSPLTPEQCAARGIRHSSTDDHSTAVLSIDPDWMLQGALRAAGRRCRV